MSRRRWAWEYTEWHDDPHAANDRAALANGPMNSSDADAAAARYFRRCSDHAAKWIADSPSAETEDRDRAASYRAAMERNAELAERGWSHDPDAAVERALQEMERAYAETGNRYFVWRAISMSLHRDPPSLPDWCVAPLRATAGMIAILGLPGARPATGANILAALDLTRQGRSAHVMARRHEKKVREAEWAAKLNAKGMPVERARAAATGFRVRDTDTLRHQANRKRKGRGVKPPAKSSPDPLDV